MSLKIDVFPAPLRPMMPHRSPSATVKVMFLKSSVAPNETPTLASERSVTRRWGRTRELWRHALARGEMRCALGKLSGEHRLLRAADADGRWSLSENLDTT